MEDALVPVLQLVGWGRNGAVLILVLMEDALVPIVQAVVVASQS